MGATERAGDASPRLSLSRNVRHGFTLFEMLVVMVIITIFVGVIGYGFIRGSASSTVGLQASQSIVAGMLTQARSQAANSGNPTGLFVAAGPTGGFAASTDAHIRSRYLRCLVVARLDGANWTAVSDLVFLPPDVYVVPEGIGKPRRVTSEIRGGEDWFRCNDSGVPSAGLDDVDSSALDASTDKIVPYSVAGGEKWIYVEFTPRGTKRTNGAGTIAVANGDRQPPTTSGPPIVLRNPDNVRGVYIPTNGQLRLLDDRRDF